MKLFKFILGDEERVGVFVDKQAAHDGRKSIDPAYAYLPVEIEELTVPGYTITIEPAQAASTPPDFTAMGRSELRLWLDKHAVEYVPQWGDQRLLEAAVAAYEATKGDG